MYFIGFDLGGTKIEAMLLHFGPLQFKNRPLLTFEFQKSNGEIVQGYVLYKKRVPTERHLGYEQIIEKMAKLAHEVCYDVCASLENVSGVSILLMSRLATAQATQLASSANTGTPSHTAATLAELLKNTAA